MRAGGRAGANGTFYAMSRLVCSTAVGLDYGELFAIANVVLHVAEQPVRLSVSVTVPPAPKHTHRQTLTLSKAR